jgi:carbamoyltransferase
MLISKFYDLTGCPVIVNTSFNVRGEPVVNSPEEAFNCMMGTEIEFLAVGNCIMRKEDQDKNLFRDYKNNFDADSRRLSSFVFSRVDEHANQH